MPPKRPHSESPASEGCLAFQDWKALRASGQRSERACDAIYDPSCEESPDKPWYSFDHKDIENRVNKMCMKLLKPVRRFASVDLEIGELIAALHFAKALPGPTNINIAVVGDQGIGKSSLINALLHRDLVDVSASSTACTAFATIIKHKRGAPDSTQDSDVEVEFLNKSEIREFVEEQIRRYADVYSSARSNDGNDGGEQSHNTEDSSADDSSDDEISLLQPIPTDGRRKIPEALQRGADTAKDFFHIIFGTREDDTALRDLETWLLEPDLEDGRFLNHCVDIALRHLSKIHATEGSLLYTNVTDEQLQNHREFAATIWPLVRSVTIYTGSIILRHGVCFLDLPGYGDLNQTRTAVVNDYRRKANFEMVVAKSDRYLSSTTQDRYLTRAIQQHKAQNTILVLNKADSILTTSTNEIMKLINGIAEEPFLSIKSHLSETSELRGETPALIRAYKQYLIKEAQLAHMKREANHVREQMIAKGVRVFSVSAGQYMNWKDPHRLEDPLCEPEATGIISLRRHLLTLPAEANHRGFSDHLFEVLPDIDDQVERILAKFEGDDSYSTFNAHLMQKVSELDLHLNELAETEPRSLISPLWTYTEEQDIIEKFEATAEAWKHPNVHYSSFKKMLRENGIPVSGKAKGKNFNDEILEQYKQHLGQWNRATLSKANALAEDLDDPIQALLNDIQYRFDQTPTDPHLKQSANEALRKSVQRINTAQGALIARLTSSVSDNYLHFSTENDIHCPIAREMKDVYLRVGQMVRPRKKKLYMCQREELIFAVTQSTDEQQSIISAMQDHIIERQTKMWQETCKTFATEVSQLLKSFTRITQNLLARDDHKSAEYVEVREKLSKHIPEFQRALLEIQTRFPAVEAHREIKRARFTPSLPTRLSTPQTRESGYEGGVKREEV